MNEQESKEILSKLEAIMRLAALQLIEGRPQPDQCLLLTRAGFQPKEIADLLGTTRNTVRVTLSNIRASRKPRLRKNDSPKG
jgi:DNA-directed RNA polymerase specialized sigma24 family protein